MKLLNSLLEKLGFKESKPVKCSWCGNPTTNKSRPTPFDNYVCSARCDIGIGLFFDGATEVEINEHLAKVDAMSPKEFKQHCKQAMVKP